VALGEQNVVPPSFSQGSYSKSHKFIPIFIDTSLSLLATIRLVYQRTYEQSYITPVQCSSTEALCQRAAAERHKGLRWSRIPLRWWLCIVGLWWSCAVFPRWVQRGFFTKRSCSLEREARSHAVGRGRGRVQDRDGGVGMSVKPESAHEMCVCSSISCCWFPLSVFVCVFVSIIVQRCTNASKHRMYGCLPVLVGCH
jgi:hypothetical protein